MSKQMLFAGQPMFLGGLSNEEELVKYCPNEFKEDNPWSDYAMKLFFRGGMMSNWKWRSEDNMIRDRQLSCLNGLLGTFGISHNDKTAVSGWMLSEMLTEVPQHIPLEEKEAP